MNNLVADVGRSREFYKGKSIDFAGLWTPGVRYFNDEYLTNFVVYAEKDSDGKVIASALLGCKQSIGAYHQWYQKSLHRQRP